MKSNRSPGRRDSSKGVRARQHESRRTTVTLPTPLLRRAERVALSNHQTLSSAIAGLIEDGLRNRQSQMESGTQVLEAWKRAFANLTEDERMLVDGIILEDAGPMQS